MKKHMISYQEFKTLTQCVRVRQMLSPPPHLFPETVDVISKKSEMYTQVSL